MESIIEPCSVTGSSDWWTMSPYKFFGYNAFVFYVGGSDYAGFFENYYVDYDLGVARPVVSLVSGALVSSGDGTAEAPYLVEISA